MPESDDDLFGPEHIRVYRETKGERGYHWRSAEAALADAVRWFQGPYLRRRAAA